MPEWVMLGCTTRVDNNGPQRTKSLDAWHLSSMPTKSFGLQTTNSDFFSMVELVSLLSGQRRGEHQHVFMTDNTFLNMVEETVSCPELKQANRTPRTSLDCFNTMLTTFKELYISAGPFWATRLQRPCMSSPS